MVKKMSSDIVKRGPFKGFLYALGGTILVSTNLVTAKYGLRGFNPETFTLIWSGAAALYALIIVLATGHKHEIVLSSSHNTMRVILMGLAASFSMMLAWQGLSWLDPSFASFIWRFQPVLAIIFGVLLLNERLFAKELFPITLMVFGGCLSTLGRWNIVGSGTVLTILACCAVSVQMLIAKIISTKIHPNVLAFYRVAIGSVFIALWTFLMGKADFDVELSYWLVTLLGSFLAPCASFFLTFRSYRYWELSRASMVKTMQPLLVLPMAYIVFGTIPAGRTLLGGVLILVGAFWLSWIHLLSSQDQKST
jgi:drug/metabolite transporter (DMT)-like permease